MQSHSREATVRPRQRGEAASNPYLHNIHLTNHQHTDQALTDSLININQSIHEYITQDAYQINPEVRIQSINLNRRF